MKCAHCKKKIRARNAEPIYYTPDGSPVGLHPRCYGPYNGEEEEDGQTTVQMGGEATELHPSGAVGGGPERDQRGDEE